MDVEVTGLVCVRCGRLSPSDIECPKSHVWLPAVEAEPYFTRFVTSTSLPGERTSDGRFDLSHLAPEKAYRIGRDYLAHCIRYGWPMKVVKDRFGAGARMLELGCGEMLPLFRTLTCDHSAVTTYKPSRFVGADLNFIKYHPEVTGIETTILSNTNVVLEPEKLPDEVFDLVISFEVLEHMDKEAQEGFIDFCVGVAKRRWDREQKPGYILLSTPVNSGRMAKNHLAEVFLNEMERFWTRRNVKILERYGTFANLRDLVPELTAFERHVWNNLANYHSPDVLVSIFSANHPEVARNIAWLIEVGEGATTVEAKAKAKKPGKRKVKLPEKSA